MRERKCGKKVGDYMIVLAILILIFFGSITVFWILTTIMYLGGGCQHGHEWGTEWKDLLKNLKG
jgi:hypothetical protein